jgi:hypothetical protein
MLIATRGARATRSTVEAVRREDVIGFPRLRRDGRTRDVANESPGPGAKTSVEPSSPLHPGGSAGTGSGQHHEEVVAGDVPIEIDPARVGRHAFARSRRRLPARVVDLAVHNDQPIPLIASRGCGMESRILRRRSQSCRRR